MHLEARDTLMTYHVLKVFINVAEGIGRVHQLPSWNFGILLKLNERQGVSFFGRDCQSVSDCRRCGRDCHQNGAPVSNDREAAIQDEAGGRWEERGWASHSVPFEEVSNRDGEKAEECCWRHKAG